MRPIDADALEELFREVIGRIAKKPEMNGNFEHMVRASAMVIEMIKDAPTVEERTEERTETHECDLISRQTAIDALCSECQGNCIPCEHYPCGDVKALEQLPPPAERTGHWIKISPADIYECSECGKTVMTSDIDAYDFCHGCGAKMEVEHD